MPVDEVVEHIVGIVVVVHGTVVGVERSYVLVRSVGNDGIGQGIAGIGIEAETDTQERQWKVRSFGQSSAGVEEVAVGTEVGQQMEQELGKTSVERTADAAGRIDQLCDD